MDDRTALYRFFDAGGALLYVGITCNPPSRLGQHGVDKYWWDTVAGMSVEWHLSRRAALVAEKQAIVAEQPKHNIESSSLAAEPVPDHLSVEHDPSGTSMIPTWLQRHLEDRGLWDADGVGRAARARRCRCRMYVLAGLDGDRCALPVAADPDPLSPRGEAVALIAGRSTYSLRFLSGRLELDRRGHFEIRGTQYRLDILAGHVCDRPSLGLVAGLGAASRIAPPPSIAPFGDCPPY